ncbi:MAG: metal ABC transporter solute-binding protein, Zn/Mn family [Bifidobacterium sp.]
MSIMSNAKRALAVVAAAATLFSMAACGSSNADSSAKSDSSSAAASSGKIEVVASINQWGSVAEDLGGSNVEVTNIMTKTNVEAHDYEPTSQDVAKFGTAKVAVVNGADYDPWATKAAQPTKATLVTAAETAGIKEGDNPHVWFSAKVRSNTADAITAAYQKADPSHKDDYAKLNKEWHAKEDQLESRSRRLPPRPRPAVRRHRIRGLVPGRRPQDDRRHSEGLRPGLRQRGEPTPADIKDFQDTLKAGFIKMFVFNSQEANSTIDQITGAAKDANVPIVELAEQMPKQYTNLLDWMSALVDQFAAAVK